MQRIQYYGIMDWLQWSLRVLRKLLESDEFITTCTSMPNNDQKTTIMNSLIRTNMGNHV